MILRRSLKGKISGSDLLPELCKISAEKGYRIFLLGGWNEAPHLAANNLKSLYPSIKVTGVYSPPLNFEKTPIENNKVISMINDSKPDMLFVGLGAPKQEKWIYNNLEKINATVSIGVGASIEFIAGAIKRAPKWMINCGFEWLWRLIQEPKRLWKRYLINDLKIFYYFFKELKK